MIDRPRSRYPRAFTSDFGDTPGLSEHLIKLVREGKKTATSSALRDYQVANEPLPEVGRHEIVLDFSGEPALVLKTIWVEVIEFDAVDWSFARDEGEDETLESWRATHKEFFARNGGFNWQMQLVCQRFVLVEDLRPQ